MRTGLALPAFPVTTAGGTLGGPFGLARMALVFMSDTTLPEASSSRVWYEVPGSGSSPWNWLAASATAAAESAREAAAALLASSSRPRAATPTFPNLVASTALDA